MITPDPNNPQDGDQFIADRVSPPVTMTIVHVHGGYAWCSWRDGDLNVLCHLATVATWKPVTQPPPDLWRTFDADGTLLGISATVDHAAEYAKRYPGAKIARYTFAEWVTP